ncbi:MAG: YbaK/EbsC family protein [Pseudomonadota bacterium]
MIDLPASAAKVQAALDQAKVKASVQTFPASTRTAADAAAAIGCSVAQIAKSLVFKSNRDGRAILVIASGENRVNERGLSKRIAEELNGDVLGRADADFVRQETGYAIGGVPPVGHEKPLLTVLDQDLERHDEIWAAAGTPNAVFRISFNQLQTLTGGLVCNVT